MQKFESFEDDLGRWGMVYENDVPLIGSHAWHASSNRPSRLSIMWWGGLAPELMLKFCVDAKLVHYPGQETFSRCYDGKTVRNFKGDWAQALLQPNTELVNVAFGLEEPTELMSAKILLWGAFQTGTDFLAPTKETKYDDLDENEEGRDWPAPENLGVYMPPWEFFDLITPLENYVCATHFSKPSVRSAREAVETLVSASDGIYAGAYP